ncbi:protein kinase subdomain-containing protein PKL/ccin9 [Russula earlei]|uniref:Protein kinase subdomain-containing protein PKL/ccin9 n=1 Tax=Russula earlei TaxID=71964 RepID=A0ACC0UJL5_9AGAM|nr:protein kinase subdomain-containing protein PKL/ccin9 [Russula earlei]
MAANLDLFVYIIGLGNAFPVNIERSKTVDHLKKAIVREKPNDLKGVDADRLKLYQVDLPDDEDLEEAAKQATEGQEPLKVSSRLLSKIFQRDPLEERVSILVEVPEIETGSRFDGKITLESLRKRKIVSTSASRISTQKMYRSIQAVPRERIWDDRPESDSLPPISLLYDGFGHFLDIYKGRHNTRAPTKARGKLEMAVDSFSERMTKLYNNEASRMDEGLGTIRNGRTDGHFLGPHGAVSCVVEFKNELADINSIPAVELVSYIAKSHTQAMKDQRGPFRWRVPCLGLTIVDNDIQLFVKGDGAIPHDVNLPYISALTRRDNKDVKLEFRIIGLHHDTQDYRHLYIAKTPDENIEIIVKFSRRYSIELHELCAHRRHAPKILGFQELPGGWFAIAMEYISSPVSPSSSQDLEGLCDELWKLMEDFHDRGFVHGDLREPNILYDGERMILLDFDWGGKVGDAMYPTGLLTNELTDGRAEDADSTISKDDDRRVLLNTINTIKNRKSS